MEGNFDDVFKTRPYPAENGKENAFAPAQTATYADPAKNAPSPAGQRLYQERKAVSSVNISVGDILELNSISYQVQGVISGAGRSSEASIYRITNSTGKDFALKLYYEFPDESLEPSPDTLQRIREISGGEILGLFDFGTGPNKYLNRYCFEISDFAHGGDLIAVENLRQKFTPAFIENVVVAGIFRGIQMLHNERIYHCDLKPHNVFFPDREKTRVVIGDYGSAKSFDKTNAKELNYTTLTKGTEFYLAPEQAFGIVSEKNDYYSLGMIVLHLLYPEFVSHDNLRRIFERRTKGIQIVDFDERFPRLNRLIEGLTLQDYNMRWGHREVARWIDGLDVPVGYQQHERKIRLKVGMQEMFSGKDLADYIRKGNPFYEALIEDRDGYGMLLTWIDTMEGEESRKTFDAMISHYKKYFGIDYVKQAMESYFNPAFPMVIGPKTYDFADPEKLAENLHGFVSQIDEIWKFTDIETLRYYFFLFEFAVRRLRVKSKKDTASLIDKIFGAIAEIVNTDYNPDFTSLRAGFYISLEYAHILEILYVFIKNRGFKDHDNRRYETLFEVNEFFAEDRSLLSDRHLLLERDAFVKNSDREEFLEFIAYNPDWHHFFLTEVTGLSLLTGKISEILSERYSRTFVEGFCQRMAELDPEYFRLAILRTIEPQKPYVIAGREIPLFTAGDFNNKVREIFGLLDKHRLQCTAGQIKVLFFEFEFILLQLAAADPIHEKILVRPLMTKMAEILGDFGGDIVSLQPYWFQHLSNRRLIGLFYLFNPQRNFPGAHDEVITNIRELGMYFAANPEKYQEPRSADEREAFLENRNYRSFAGLGIQEFVMKIFRDQAQLKVDVHDVVLGEPEYHQSTVIYDYQLSLEAFFTNQNIPFAATEKSGSPVTAVLKGGQFTGTTQLYHQFAGMAIRRHQPAAKTLQGDSENEFSGVLKQRKHEQRFGGIRLLPRYFVFVLPVFVVLYFVVKYLSGTMLFSVFGHEFTFAAELAWTRLARENLPVLITSAYLLNLFPGAALLLAFAVVFHDRKIFYRFFDYHAGLLRRLILFMIFAPVVAIVAYLLLGAIVVRPLPLIPGAGGFSLTTVIVVLYTGLLLHQLISLVVELFRMYRKLYIFPFVVTLVLFLIMGYFSMIRPVVRSETPRSESAATLLPRTSSTLNQHTL